MRNRLFVAFLMFLLVAAVIAPASAAPIIARGDFQPLANVVVVLDAGHGELGGKYLFSDPGSGEPTKDGLCAWECTFSWDTTMRLRRALIAAGATVVMTTHDPAGDYEPKDWGPYRFPTVPTEKHKHCRKLAQGRFTYKVLFKNPNPKDDMASLDARVGVANDVYRKERGSKDIYFISLHFDALSDKPHPIAGMAIHIKPGGGSPFVDYFLDEVRRVRRVRLNLKTGLEAKSREESGYRILRRSDNKDAYLIELGHIRSRDPQTGKNPDLFRMRNPKTREDYGRLICRALVRYVLKRPLVATTPLVLPPRLPVAVATPQPAKPRKVTVKRPGMVRPQVAAKPTGRVATEGEMTSPRVTPLTPQALRRWRVAQIKTAKAMRSQVPKDGALKGLVVYLDPGHGIEGGGVRWPATKSIVESRYVWDVAVRLAKYLRRRGGEVRFTVRHPNDHRALKAQYWHPTQPVPPLVDLQLLAKPSALAKTAREQRLSARASVVRRDKGERTLFLSLHAEPLQGIGSGVAMWASQGSSDHLMGALKGVLKGWSVMAYFLPPPPESGAAASLGFEVLDPRFNAAGGPRVLVNLANPAEGADRQRLADALGRERLARQLAAGLVKFYKGGR